MRYVVGSSTKPFPSICEVFVEVKREESRRMVMLTSLSTTESDTSLSTLTTHQNRIHAPHQQNQKTARSNYGAVIITSLTLQRRHV